MHFITTFIPLTTIFTCNILSVVCFFDLVLIIIIIDMDCKLILILDWAIGYFSFAITDLYTKI